jgi:hypothetical protein
METRPLRIVRRSPTRWTIEVQKRFLWWSWWVTIRTQGVFPEELNFSSLTAATEYAEYLRQRDFTAVVVREYSAITKRTS